MSTNQKVRKQRKEFARGLSNGQGIRPLESGERDGGEGYSDGFSRGRVILHAKEKRAEELKEIDRQFQSGIIDADRRNAEYGTRKVTV